MLVRYDADGALDPSFGEGGAVALNAGNAGNFGSDDVLHAVAIAPSGRIIAVGARGESRYGSDRENLITAYTPTGQIDRSFGRGGRVAFPHLRTSRTHPATALTSVKVLGSGKILVAGYLFGRLLLARLTANGRFDPNFGGGDGKVSLKIEELAECCGEWASLALQQDGKILVTGRASGPRRDRLALARFRPNGTLDPSFGEGGLAPKRTTLRMPNPRDLAVQGDGRIVVVGYGFGVTKSEPAALSFRALRYLPNGKLDQSFGQGGLQLLSPGAQNAAFAALTQANGRVVAAGSLALKNGGRYEAELMLTRYLSGQGPGG